LQRQGTSSRSSVRAGKIPALWKIPAIAPDFPAKKSVSGPLSLRMPRLFATILPVVLLLAAVRTTLADGTAALDAGVQNFVNVHCMSCHDADSEKGDFRIDKLSSKVGLEDTPQWLAAVQERGEDSAK